MRQTRGRHGHRAGDLLRQPRLRRARARQRPQLSRKVNSEEILISVVTRCRNLKSLSLLFSKNKNDASVTVLTRYLKHSLEELEIFASNDSDMTFEKLLDLRSLQKLRIFNCYDLRLIREEITTLERTLPHLIRPINEKMIYKLGVVNPEEGISEIHAKKLKIFAEN